MISLPKIIIYDLDGTIIDTADLHIKGWSHAFQKIGQLNKFEEDRLPEGFESYQKGRGGDEAAKYIYGDNALPDLIKQFRKIKGEYVADKIGNSPIFPGFIETHDQIIENGSLVWICTSAPGNQVNSILEKHPALQDRLKGQIVFEGMYSKSKPSPEPIFATLKLAGEFRPADGLYVGDAHSDYMAAASAGTGFVYFCPLTEMIDDKIPADIKRIQYHKDIFDVI